MDVYLVPVSGERYELYFEVDHDAADVVKAAGAGSSWWRRKLDRFREMLAEAERDRLLRERGIDSGRTGIGRWMMSKIAEVVAEQRLLWHLRDEETGRLIHPVDITGGRAVELAKAEFGRDLRKHRRWAVIDTLLAAVLGPALFFVPGPNIIAYYFLFRGVGHYLSMRGAQQGILRTRWEATPSDHLAEVRAALELPRAERRAVLDRIAQALGLNHLAAFVERVAARPS